MAVISLGTTTIGKLTPFLDIFADRVSYISKNKLIDNLNLFELISTTISSSTITASSLENISHISNNAPFTNFADHEFLTYINTNTNIFIESFIDNYTYLTNNVVITPTPVLEIISPFVSSSTNVKSFVDNLSHISNNNSIVNLNIRERAGILITTTTNFVINSFIDNYTYIANNRVISPDIVKERFSTYYTNTQLISLTEPLVNKNSLTHVAMNKTDVSSSAKTSILRSQIATVVLTSYSYWT